MDKTSGHTYGMIYLLTAIGLSPSGSSTVHTYTQTIHRTTQNKQYIEKHKNFGQYNNFGQHKNLHSHSHSLT
jgi:hypothetical protein